MLGTRDRMPANRMMEIPLPIPNSVICSPIHMTKEEPAMKETINDQSRPDADCSVQDVVVLHQHIVAEALQDGDGHRGVAGDGLDLLLALLAAVLGQPLQSGNGDGQQLDDDGGC